MCEFFSFVTNKGKIYYFGYEQRKTEKDPDSHSRIAEVFFNLPINCDRSNTYEYVSGRLIKDQINDPEESFDDVKDAFDRFKMTREFWQINLLGIIKGYGSLENVREDKRAATERLLHLHACWSAEQALPLFESRYPDDKRPRLAIEAKRKWLNGEITDEELNSASSAASAAYSAASPAAWSAAWSAARSAAYSASSSAAYSAASEEEARSAQKQNRIELLSSIDWTKWE